MKGAPPTRHAQISDMQVIIKCVDQRGREMDERWGIGRLPMLVPIEWRHQDLRSGALRVQRGNPCGPQW